MKFIISFDSFKGTLTSIRACLAAEEGVKAVFPHAETVCIPMADGGEGTVDAYRIAAGGTVVCAPAASPSGKRIKAKYLILPDGRAVIECAAASGLTLVRGAKNPGEATSYGTGELIRDAVNRGCRSFIIGLGGSATNDGGAGALTALGAKLLDSGSNPIPPGGNGLSALSHIDLSGLPEELRDCDFSLACDVTNPLCGPEGASAVFGPQKGAKPEDVIRLDANLARFARVIKHIFGKDVLNLKGGGAAGGMCAGFYAFLNAKPVSGIDLMISACDFYGRARGADFIFSGEGRADSQSPRGKALSGIGKAAKELGVPFVVIAGALGAGYEGLYGSGATAAFASCRGERNFSEIKKNAGANLTDTVKNICLLIRASRGG